MGMITVIGVTTSAVSQLQNGTVEKVAVGFASHFLLGFIYLFFFLFI